MDRLLRPDRFDTEPSAPGATKKWIHWLRTFTNFIESLSEENQSNKLNLLINYVSPIVFEFISDSETYENAIKSLNDLYNKPKNIIFARHLLATCKQESGQNLDQFLQNLKSLAKDCDFKNATALQIRDDAIRDSFISGLVNNSVRQRLLENDSLNLEKAFDMARSLELAQQQSLSYNTPNTCGATAEVENIPDESNETDKSFLSAASAKCFFCGFGRHPRARCPAREAECKSCGKIGHYQKVCKSKSTKKTTSAMNIGLLSSLTAVAGPIGLERALVPIKVNGKSLTALIDTGSSESYISKQIPHKEKWKIKSSRSVINMASTSLTNETKGHCNVQVEYKNNNYNQIKLHLLPELCADVILGHDFLQLHTNLVMSFQGEKKSFSVCGVTAAKVKAPSLFQNLTEDCKPIATKSRRQTPDNEKFINGEIKNLLQSGIIEPSTSPWRAQVLVVNDGRHKKRLCMDYSQTINRYTLLDAYPLPRIDQMVENIASYKVFSTLDLKSAYHQIPISTKDKPYTAFEAGGRLYQFTRIPFGVTNGVATFQRIISEIIDKESLSGVVAYVDNVTICGENQEDHDKNLKLFRETAKKHNLTFNDNKEVLSVPEIDLLGYRVSHRQIKPDPERLRPLKEMPPPSSLKSQKRAVGMFSYYSNWISEFSKKIHPLNHNETFPLPDGALQSFLSLKTELEQAVLITIDPTKPLTVETDASETTLSASLNQEGRPVAFFSRTLSPCERNHSAPEKEACAIVEAVKKWRHFLLNNHFQLITDQEAVAFIFNYRKKGKIKNEKIQRWKIELACFSYDIIYRPGSENTVADALSRATCGAASSSTALHNLHEALCHPGVTRMFHFVKARNLPYSVEEVRIMTANCAVCREIKPTFHKPKNQRLIKATQPFERLSVDFKGPLPSISRNRYILTMTDEFSRFPFAFACSDMTSATVINCFSQLFTMYGMPGYVHSDRGPSFMSEELKTFLHSKGVATSRTTPYNPRCNGQVEKLNGTLWKAVQLSLKSRNLEINQWEVVLLDALHSIRSLLCTATNCTPHERMFNFTRRSTAGNSLPTWLMTPGPVYLKRNVRASKFEPVVDEVELISANPQYAFVRLKNGKEATVSLRQLAPVGEIIENPDSEKPETNDNNQKGSPELQPLATPEEPMITEEAAEDDLNSSRDIPTEPEVRPESDESEALRQPFIRTRHYDLRNGWK